MNNILVPHLQSVSAGLCKWLLVSAVICLAGCSTLLKQPAVFSDEAVNRCTTFYQQLQIYFEKQRVQDAVYTKIPGYPFFRNSRFLASFATDLLSAEVQGNSLSPITKHAFPLSSEKPVQYQLQFQFQRQFQQRFQKRFQQRFQKRFQHQLEQRSSNQLSKKRDWMLHLNANAREALLIEYQQLSREKKLHLKQLLLPFVKRNEKVFGDSVFRSMRPDSIILKDRVSYPVRSDRLSYQLQYCGTSIINYLEKDTSAFKTFLQQIYVPDHYQSWKRWLGFYPLLKIPFRQGVLREHKKTARLEAACQSERYVKGTDSKRLISKNAWVTYLPEWSLNQLDGKRVFERLRTDALGIPFLSASEKRQILDVWAPAWKIETQSDYDRIGRMEWDGHHRPVVNVDQPGFYSFVTFGRYNKAVTVQLNYSIWLPGRKKEKPFDLLAGELDGLTWRIHLNLSGQVLAADTIHNCGCWYQIYPAQGYTVDRTGNSDNEPVYSSMAGKGKLQGPVQLSLQANTHYLIGVERYSPKKTGEQSSTVFLSSIDYDQLRTLPLADNQAVAGSQFRVSDKSETMQAQIDDVDLLSEGPYRCNSCADGLQKLQRKQEIPVKSLFGPNGIVAISRRAERWLFWPMGILSPGAMRIRGTHAIAFIGKRHFDDPELLSEVGLVKNPDHINTEI